MPWTIIIIVVSILVFIFVLGAIIFGCVNANKYCKPKVLTFEREIRGNKKRGLWLDFDSYDKEEFTVEGKGGYILNCVFVSTEQTRKTGKYVIICHGHTSSRYGAVKYANCYIKLGFSCIIYDARTHGANKPDTCTLGYVESEDLKHVIDDTRAKHSDIRVLGLQGESMGSSTVIHSLRFDPKVDFIVSDCCFIGSYEELFDCYKNIHMQWLTPSIWLAAKALYKVDIKKTNSLRCLTNCKTPILFVHGTGDTLVKPFNAEMLHAKAKEEGAYTELVFVEGAGHAECRWKAGFEAYTGYISNFLKNIGIE